MPTPYVERTLEPVLRRVAREFPVVVLTGPRQAGKTTLLRRCFGEAARYVSLDLPDVMASAAADPRGFLAAHPPPVIFDEVQNAPDLLPYIRVEVDEARTRKGQYFLSGSQNILLAERVSESLAGRAGVLRLLPLSLAESAGDPGRSPFWARERGPAPTATHPERVLWESMLRGGSPELAVAPERDAALWHASYVQTYLERDVRTLRQVGDLGAFQAFLRALAARSGGLLNLHDLSRDLGIAVNTAKAWLAVLEATYVVVIVRPYHANLGKRLVKTPKVYFTDVGLLCWLVGIRDAEHLRHGPMAGAALETLVCSELVKAHWHRGEDLRFTFWRTSTGEEVDFLVEVDAEVHPIEVKSTATPRPAMAGSIEQLTELLPNVASGVVVHAGDSRLPLGKAARALPWFEL